MGIRRSGDIRNVRDIHTYSGRVDAGAVPYLGYMKVSSLEREKARREQERNSALERIRNIDSRINDIEAEKSIILKKLGENQDSKRELPSTNDGTRHGNSVVPARSFFQSGNGNYRDKDGFKIRY
jgi:hypothetical protein